MVKVWLIPKSWMMVPGYPHDLGKLQAPEAMNWVVCMIILENYIENLGMF
jgi:hypothetical protein